MHTPLNQHRTYSSPPSCLESIDHCRPIYSNAGRNWRLLSAFKPAAKPTQLSVRFVNLAFTPIIRFPQD